MKNLNWKLILFLSLLGFAMALATVSLVPANIEPIIWLIIFIICAYLIARQSSGKFFQHGFLVSLINSVWITSAHIIFFKTYIAYHPQQVSMLAKTPMPQHPRLMMAITGLIIGIILGLVLGFFSFIAGKMVKKY